MRKISLLILVSCLRIALELPRFVLESLESGSDLGVSVCLVLCLLEILRLCIDDDMSCMMTWLLGDLFYYG